MAEGPRILVISSVRDEGSNLLHWLAHCRGAGVGDFLIASNDCTDGCDTLLDLLEAGGVLTHLRNDDRGGRPPQWAALRLAHKHPLTLRADWIAVLDCDEYINLRPPYGTLQDLIDDTDADAIALPWRLFGHGGHAARPSLPPTRAFTRAIPPDALHPPLSRFVKTLYRRRAPFSRPGVHRPRQRPGSAPRWVNGSGMRLPDSWAADPSQILLWGAPLAHARVQLNHYALRSAQDFLAKSRRGLPNHTDKPVDLAYWVERNFNTVPEDTILRMEPRTEAELDRLRAIPGVAEAEARSLTHHEAQFQRALGNPETLALFGQLLVAASSVPPSERMARHLAALYSRARDGDA